MRGLIIGALLSLLAAACQAALPTKARRCEVESGGDEYRGLCLVDTPRPGSIRIRAKDRRPLQGNAIQIEIVRERDNLWRIWARSVDGKRYDWGRAKRSPDRKGCWLGTDGNDSMGVCLF
jgi:hypothetical protein